MPVRAVAGEVRLPTQTDHKTREAVGIPSIVVHTAAVVDGVVPPTSLPQLIGRGHRYRTAGASGCGRDLTATEFGQLDHLRPPHRKAHTDAYTTTRYETCRLRVDHELDSVRWGAAVIGVFCAPASHHRPSFSTSTYMAISENPPTSTASLRIWVSTTPGAGEVAPATSNCDGGATWAFIKRRWMAFNSE